MATYTLKGSAKATTSRRRKHYRIKRSDGTWFEITVPADCVVVFGSLGGNGYPKSMTYSHLQVIETIGGVQSPKAVFENIVEFYDLDCKKVEVLNPIQTKDDF